MLTALIVDDEPLARTHLRRLLEEQNVAVLGEAGNAAEALQSAEDLRPNLLFLDVQMPGLTGMQTASALLHLECAPLVIFVTGYSEYAVSAFDNDALDYLLKPVAPDRLAHTLVRARARLSDVRQQERDQNSVDIRARSVPLRRLPVREDYAVRLVRVEDILYATTREKRVMVRTSAKEYRTYYTLTHLESLLPVEQFLRIHESYIVHIEYIEELLFLGNHSYSVRLSNGAQVPVGRTRYAELQTRLGLNDVTLS